MAGGLNKQFKRNPSVFLQTHSLMVNPQALGSRVIAPGLTNIDLVMVDNKTNPKFVRLESFDLRTHSRGADPIVSYYLPATVDGHVTTPLGINAAYMFTPDLSGCLFAAYGPNASNLTVEHVNVRTGNAPANLIVNRAANAMQSAYYRIISPVALGVANANIVTYATGANVIGVRNGAAWQFIYRVDAAPVAQF